MTLTNDEIRRIVEGVVTRHRDPKRVAEQYEITPARVSQLISKFKRTGKYPIILSAEPNQYHYRKISVIW